MNPMTCRPLSFVQQINYTCTWTMSLQNFEIVDLFINFPVILQRCFNLNCSDGIFNFFRDCMYHVVKGNVKLEERLPPNSLHSQITMRTAI